MKPQGLMAVLLALASGCVLAQQQQQRRPAQPAQAQTAQQVFEDARALGTAQAQTGGANLRNGQSQGVLTNTVRGAADNPPERQMYGRQDTSTDLASMRARCAADPNDAVCSSTRIGTASRPDSGLTPTSPVFAGQEAARNPTSVLGDIANTYNACSRGGELLEPAQFARRTCTIETGSWQVEPCTKTLQVSPTSRRSCEAGAVLASATMGSGDVSTVSALCPAAATTRIPFWFDARGSRGSCSGPLDVTLDLGAPQPGGSGPPPSAGMLQPHWQGSCFPVRVFWSTPGCRNGQCPVSIDIVQDPGITPTYACSAGTLGSLIAWQEPPALADSTCYAEYPDAEAAGGIPGGWGTYQNRYAYWGTLAPASETGWGWAPGVHHSTTLVIPQPTLLPAGGDRWTNTCESQEARTPLLPKDGITVANQQVIPGLGLTGQEQCVRTRSVCTDGPSTRVIDGVPVTRECWAYSNEFQCTTLVDTSTCSNRTMETCSPAGAATCNTVDPLGRCTQASYGFDCKTRDAVFSDAVNCGNASYCAGGSCWQRNTTANSSFPVAVSQLEAHMQAGLDMDVDGSNIQIFKGQDRRCNLRNLGIDNCCSDSAYIQQCSTEEQETYRLKQRGLCHEVGEFCASRGPLGICLRRQRSACCFSSILPRLIQEQGRDQLRRGWGDVRSPDCSGFTPDELVSLDWSQFDLSEFYASIQATPLNQGTTQGVVQGRQSGCYYGQGKC